jgi:hypothetical protein
MRCTSAVAVSTLLVLVSLSGAANAATIVWGFQGRLSALTDDPLGVDGARIHLRLEFDTTGVWQRNPVPNGALYFPAATALVTINQGHTITLNSALPTATYGVGGNFGVRDVVQGPYVRFTINDVLTSTFNANTSSPRAPVEGVPLALAHLSTDRITQFASIAVDGVQAYEFENKIVFKGELPEPSTGLLLAAALLVAVRRGR